MIGIFFTVCGTLVDLDVDALSAPFGWIRVSPVPKQEDHTSAAAQTDQNKQDNCNNIQYCHVGIAHIPSIKQTFEPILHAALVFRFASRYSVIKGFDLVSTRKVQNGETSWHHFGSSTFFAVVSKLKDSVSRSHHFGAFVKEPIHQFGIHRADPRSGNAIDNSSVVVVHISIKIDRFLHSGVVIC